jgi:hypothetical protein
MYTRVSNVYALVCVHVYVPVCMHMCVYAYACTCAGVRIHSYICRSTRVWTFCILPSHNIICLCMCIFVCTLIACTYAHNCSSINACMCYVYTSFSAPDICVYTHSHTYTELCVSIYTQMHAPSQLHVHMQTYICTKFDLIFTNCLAYTHTKRQNKHIYIYIHTDKMMPCAVALCMYACACL